MRGEAYIPQHTNFIVAANHSSHLDMGALKVALGDAGHDLASLAAADYFFKNKWRRAYFKNLTNLVPMERSGSIRKSLGIAERVLRGGKSLVLFPEGTRSRTGEMSDFLPSLGYLALRADVGILPAYIEGAHDAMPVGATIPKKRDLGVYFGPFLTIDFLRELTAGLSQQEAWRLCSALTQRIVENLRDRVTPRFDAQSVRAAWDGEKLGAAGAAAVWNARAGSRARLRPGGRREDPGHRRHRLPGLPLHGRAVPAHRRFADPRALALRYAGAAGARGGGAGRDRDLAQRTWRAPWRASRTSITWPASSRAGPRTRT